jgi:L-cysteine desulfidase
MRGEESCTRTALNSHGITEEEGFVGRSAEETVKNMSRISEIGMSLVDETMLAKKQ